MGLDATVYCNCFETGKLKEIPPYIDEIVITRNGSLDCKSENFDLVLEFDQWQFHRACKHENGVLIHHYIGNIARVANLHENFFDQAQKFPVILKKILYSGTHAGDFLSLEEVKKLEKEIEHLEDLVFSDETDRNRVDYFRRQLKELTKSALEMGKPISF